jgi:hypothetical protein
MPANTPPMTVADFKAIPVRLRPTTITITDQIIPVGCFFGHYALISATFLNATHIGECAFEECWRLCTVVAPQVTSVDPRAFCFCPKLDTIILPALTTAGPDLFLACTSLPTISLPNLSTVPSGMFTSCSNLRVANLPMVTIVKMCAFAHCHKLNPPTFLATVKEIEVVAFRDCHAFQALDMPHLKRLSYAAFAGCTNLHEVFMPTTTPFYANPFAFEDCTAIRLVQTTAPFQFTTTTPLIINSTRRPMGKVERNFWTRRTHRAATTAVANIAITLALAFVRLGYPAPPPELVPVILSFLPRH